MDKQTIINQVNKKTFYSREIPSLKWNGSGWGQGLCPFHNDHRPSFFANSETGAWKCMGCNNKGSIFDFVMKRRGVDFKTALGVLTRETGVHAYSRKIVRTYDYLDENGQLLFQTVRYEPKDFKQRRPDGNNGWIYNLRDVRIIPYNLPEVLKAKEVFIVEGEKDADNLKALGFTASSCPMGAGKWRVEFNQYFKGKRVFILPDNDEPGKKHGLTIAANLKDVAGSVKVVALPDLPHKGDVSDWIAQGGTKDKLIELIEQALEWSSGKLGLAESPSIEENEDIEGELYSPVIDLPYDSFPHFLKDVVSLVSPTTLAPDEFIVTAFLSVMTSVIGTRAYIQFGRRVYYPTIWSMLIAPSSDTFKSTAIREARSFVLKLDKEYEISYEIEYEAYARDLKKYDLKSREEKLESSEPVAPIRKEIDFSDDETLESFYQTLHNNPDGGLLSFDEIGGWIQGFDKYRKGDGEKRRWLTIFDNAPIKYKRKVDKTHLVIDIPFVSIIGGITTNTFNTLFKGVSEIENGFLPRFIFCKTPRLIKKDDTFMRPDICHDKWQPLFQIFRRVSELRPGAVGVCPDGLRMLDDWYRQHQGQKRSQYYPEELSPFWRRIEAYLLKIGLVIHQFKLATGEETANLISVQTLSEAMALVEYYKGQAWAVVSELCQGNEGRVYDELLELINKLGGETTTRKIMQAKRSWRGRGDYLRAILSNMEADGYITLEEHAGRGKSSLRVKLISKKLR